MADMNLFAIIRCLVCAAICASTATRGAADTKPANVSAAPAITDTAALRALVGKNVSVTGKVSYVGLSKSKFFTFIKFVGVSSDGFTVIVTAPNLPDIEYAAGSNLDAALPDRTITVSGTITLYKAVPQIELTAADQLRVHP